MLKTLLFLFFSLSCHAASMTLSSNPSPLTISKATPGKQPFTATDTSTTCDLIIPPNKTVAILAALDTPMEPHTTLKMRFLSPLQNSSSLSLGPTPQNLISSIPEGLYSSISISYEYSATVAAGVIPLRTKTIFLTLIESDR